jgi:hypothetical protein
VTDPERDALEAAYLDYLKDLFKTLTSNLATHPADPDSEDPMHRCMRGIVAARAALQAFKDALA